MQQTATQSGVRAIACLHSSGASGRQWAGIRDLVGDRFDVLTPNLIGYGAVPFTGRLRLDDEVDAIVPHIIAAGGRAHLVGHSYGGAIATRLAIRYPQRVASLTVYEPVLLSMLHDDDPGSAELDEVESVAAAIIASANSTHGSWRGARDFVNYWAGQDAWSHMADRQHARIAALIPKIAAEFLALMSAHITAATLAELRVPLRIFCGSATRRSARRAAELLAAAVPHADLRLLDGLNHMAPITHAAVVDPLVVDHIASASLPRRAAVA